MYSTKKGLPFCKSQGVTGGQIFLIHCVPTPPTLQADERAHVVQEVGHIFSEGLSY